MTASLPMGSTWRTCRPLRHASATRRRTPVAALAVMAVLAVGVLTDGPPAQAVTGHLVLSGPVAHLTVQRLASLPRQSWLTGHRGVDLIATAGAPVTAPAAGVVSYVGFVVDRPVVSIRHDQGLVSSFEPVNATVAVGDVIARGQTIGTVAGAPLHCVRQQCLHWGLRLDGAYVDPLDYLEGYGPIRLLSVDD